MPQVMTTVPAASSMSMASLYAMLGLAMPSGAAAGSSSVGSSPALAMISASNESVAAEVGTLVAGMTGSSAAAGAADFTTALMNLSNLDPTLELQRLEAAVNSQASAAALADPNGGSSSGA